MRFPWPVLACLLFLVESSALFAATPPLTPITNIATASSVGNEFSPVTAQFTFIVDNNIPAEIGLLRLTSLLADPSANPLVMPASQCFRNPTSTGSVITNPITALGNIPITAGSNIDVGDPSAYTAGEPVFIRVVDFDQNLDGTTVETIVVELVVNTSGDSELLVLIETGISTGEFIGVIQSRSVEDGLQQFNCFLEVTDNSAISARYEDENEATDVVAAAILVDPFGIYFDSATGEPIDGTVISLVNDDTGLAAVVFSPDGLAGWPSTVITGQAITDSLGRVYPIPVGEYRFPLIAPGNYRLDIQSNEGEIFPTNLTDPEIQTAPGGPYVLIVGSRGEVFNVPPGPAVQIDLPVDRPEGVVSIDKQVSHASAAIGDFVEYRISVNNTRSDIDLPNASIRDVLPMGFRYQSGSFRFNNAPAPDPIMDAAGEQLQIALGTIPTDSSVSLSYITEITAGANYGENINRAFSTTFNANSNIATASIDVLDELMASTSLLVGRVMTGSCSESADSIGIADVVLRLEDGSFVVTDSEGRWHAEDIEPGTHTLRLDEYSLPEGYELVSCEQTARSAGSDTSRFVNPVAGSIWREDFYVQIPEGADVGLSIGEQIEQLTRLSNGLGETPEFSVADLEEGFEILWPIDRATPRSQSTNIVVKHNRDQSVKVFINGGQVNPLNYEGRDASRNTEIALSRWRGVDIRSGSSILEAVLYDENDVEIGRVSRIVHFSGGPYTAELDFEKSMLKADGKSPILIAVALKDKEGFPVRPGVGGFYSVNNPHSPWFTDAQSAANDLIDNQDIQPRYQVHEGGIAYLAIEPTTLSGKVVLNVPLLEDRFEEIEAWLEPEDRDWIMVGLADGTWSDEEFTGALEPLPSDEDDSYSFNGRVAFYAKGRLPGSFLLTTAFDSAKETSDAPTSLNNQIDPDAYYTVYGDNAQKLESTVNSGSKLYLKIERQNFYALYGDMTTGLNVAELSNYSRTLSGIKTEYSSENFEFTAFAAENSLSNQRDEIFPNGISGPYLLTRTKVVEGSEIVSFEVRDRNQTGQILETIPLTLHRDYEINYQSGFLTFNSPVLSRNEDNNPIFIVVSYETRDARDSTLTAGGRIEFSDAQDRVQLGVSFISESDPNIDGELIGTDLEIEFSDTTELRAEYAETDTAAMGKGYAWLVEATEESGDLTARVRLAETGEGFGLGQQNNSESSTRKTSADLVWRPTDNQELTVIGLTLENLTEGNTTDSGSLNYKYRADIFTSEIGYIIAEDTDMDGISARSELVSTDLTLDLGKKLDLNVGAEFSPTDQAEAESFPTRYTAGLDYLLTDSVTAFAQQEVTVGSVESESTRIGLRTRPWQGGELNIGLDRSRTGEADRLSTVAGMVQRWRVNDNWAIDFSLDRGQSTGAINNSGALTAADAAPNGSPSGEAFTASTLGWDWNTGNWGWNNRIEYRDAETEAIQSFQTALVRQLNSGKTMLSSLDWIDQETSLDRREDITLSLGYADRSMPGITWLHRTDLVSSSITSALGEVQEEKLITNNHLNFNQWANGQLSLHAAAKYVVTNFYDREYNGFTTLVGAQYTHDISERIDMGLHTSALQSQNSDTQKYSAGVSIGVSPIENTQVRIGYNWSGFYDSDFRDSEYTQDGIWLSISYKFDEKSISRISEAFDRPSLELPSVPIEPQQVAEIPIPASMPESAPVVDMAAMPTVHTEIADQRNICPAGTTVRVIQLASFSNLSTARSMLETLNLTTGFIEEYIRSDGLSTVYRVTVGPYTESKADLAAAADIFQSETGMEPWIKDKDCANLRPLD